MIYQSGSAIRGGRLPFAAESLLYLFTHLHQHAHALAFTPADPLSSHHTRSIGLFSFMRL